MYEQAETSNENLDENTLGNTDTSHEQQNEYALSNTEISQNETISDSVTIKNNNVNKADENTSKPKLIRKRDEVRISENPANLMSVEGFALYIGKTKKAIIEMAKDGKLPVFYMSNPLKPKGYSELYIHRKAWDDFSNQLIEGAPPEWHSWKDWLNYTKTPRHRRS